MNILDLRELTDDQLLEALERLLGSRRRQTARMLLYLSEVEQRRLHLRAAYSSMWEFCTKQLGMEEGETHRHLNAARLGQRFPLVIELVADGRAHLSGLALLGKYLSEDNYAELLAQAAGKTVGAIEALLAARFPKPDAPELIRKLPEQPGLALESGQSPHPKPPSPLPGTSSSQQSKAASSRSRRRGTKFSLPPVKSWSTSSSTPRTCSATPIRAASSRLSSSARSIC